MARRLIGLFVALTALTVNSSPDAAAQIRASERGSVSQTVDGTTIALDFGRLQARGRDLLFGGVVPWGKVWTPGAKWATTIEVNRDITINGHALPQGKYSVWLQVQEEEWTAIFDPEPRRFHLFAPHVADNQVRFAVRPEQGEHVEVLTWSFPTVRPTGATMQLAWGTSTVTFDVRVQPFRRVTVSEDLATRYVGSYRLVGLHPPISPDTVRFDISYENERLVARWQSPPVPPLGETWMVHLGEGMFAPAMLRNGEVFDLFMDLIIEFPPVEGQANGFELRALGDELWGVAIRTP